MAIELNPEDHIIAWGEIIMSGFGSDTKVVASRLQDATKLKVGADGVCVVTINPDKSGMFVLTLLQGSDSNKKMLIEFQKQESTGKLVKKPWSITDLGGNELIGGPTTWIVKVPEFEYANEGKERVWTLYTDKLILGPGIELL